MRRALKVLLFLLLFSMLRHSDAQSPPDQTPSTSTAVPSQLPVITCKSMDQIFASNADSVVLTADLPAIATLIDLSVFGSVPAPVNPPWVRCTAASPCYKASVSAPVSQPDGLDRTIYYSVKATPFTNAGSQYAFTTQTYFRLVLTYQVPGSICAASKTLPLLGNTFMQRKLFLPEGSVIKLSAFYAHDKKFSYWLEYDPSIFPLVGVNSEVISEQGLPGVSLACRNSSAELAFCRFTLLY